MNNATLPQTLMYSNCSCICQCVIRTATFNISTSQCGKIAFYSHHHAFEKIPWNRDI